MVIALETLFFLKKYEWSCLPCRFNLIKRKHELSKIPQKKNNFINRLKYAEQKIFCICVEIYKVYEGNDYDKLYEVLSTLKNKKLKINSILFEKFKGISEKPDFEQDHSSRTAEGIYKIEHDSIRLLKWLIYYDRSYYDNMNYFDLMESICKQLILTEKS